jgi:excisionase family DNA binding protein
MPEKLLKINEVAERLTVHRATVYKLVAAGQLAPPVKLGERVARWRESDVEACIEENRGTPTSAA